MSRYISQDSAWGWGKLNGYQNLNQSKSPLLREIQEVLILYKAEQKSL